MFKIYFRNNREQREIILPEACDYQKKRFKYTNDHFESALRIDYRTLVIKQIK